MVASMTVLRSRRVRGMRERRKKYEMMERTAKMVKTGGGWKGQHRLAKQLHASTTH